MAWEVVAITMSNSWDSIARADISREGLEGGRSHINSYRLGGKAWLFPFSWASNRHCCWCLFF